MSIQWCVIRVGLFSFLSLFLALPNDSKALGNHESLAMFSLILASLVQQPQPPLWPEKSAELFQAPDSSLSGILVLILPATNSSTVTASELLQDFHASNNSRNELLPELSETITGHDLIMPSPTKTRPEIILLPSSVSLGILPVPTNTPADNNLQDSNENNPSPSNALQLPDIINSNNNDPPDPPEPPQDDEGGYPDCEPLTPVQLALYISGSGGDDPEPHDSDTHTIQDPDDKEKRFRELEREVKQLRCNPLKKWQLVGKIIRFARDNKEFATPCYQLVERLIRWESLAANFLVKLAFNEALAVSAFGNIWQATLRTVAVVIGDTTASLIPWFFPEKAWLEFLSLTAGSMMIAGTDNAFAHWTNSSYALPWLSNDYANYNTRLIFLINSNVWISKYLYSHLLIGNLAKVSHRNLIPLMIFDFAMKPVVLYLGVSVLVGTIPVICIVCAPNPIAPHHFPYPNYCPSVRWVLWQLNCNETDVEEDIEDDIPVCVPFNNTDCNCTGVEQLPMQIKPEL